MIMLPRTINQLSSTIILLLRSLKSRLHAGYLAQQLAEAL